MVQSKQQSNVYSVYVMQQACHKAFVSACICLQSVFSSDTYNWLISVDHSLTSIVCVLVSEAFHITTRLVYAVMQSRQVRQSAAENLGELTRMSMRLDQLASDLINNAKTADSLIQVIHQQDSVWIRSKSAIAYTVKFSVCSAHPEVLPLAVVTLKLQTVLWLPFKRVEQNHCRMFLVSASRTVESSLGWCRVIKSLT